MVARQGNKTEALRCCPTSICLFLTCLTVIIHALGTWERLSICLDLATRKVNQRFLAQKSRSSVSQRHAPAHLIEPGLGQRFIGCRSPHRIRDGIYFSITSYTTMGYGDVVLLSLLFSSYRRRAVAYHVWCPRPLSSPPSPGYKDRLPRGTEASGESPSHDRSANQFLMIIASLR